ncbi:GD12068 [Drosophila simulans]|uniref:GD12068 n=1 Tax=Drosophila simulans TaxID=7240 RepID=B4QL70_DROSI|nr:GD12068 [Drosophila simulans]
MWRCGDITSTKLHCKAGQRKRGGNQLGHGAVFWERDLQAKSDQKHLESRFVSSAGNFTVERVIGRRRRRRSSVISEPNGDK